jgi:hypothetical protein
MNFTQSFEEFSKGLSTTDLALYAGVGIIVWVLFKDRLSPVQQIVLSLVNKAKSLLSSQQKTSVSSVVVSDKNNNEDVFYMLITSWKQTRDLAVKSNCEEAVRVADEMFPFLSPSVCNKDENL